ncbi:MAG: putative quinol monooxygenase [Pseudomonadota bacterium]
MLRVVAKSYAKEGKVEQILQLSKEMVEKTVLEEGCISYELFQDINDPRAMIILEEWESEEALNKHIESEHFKRIIPQLSELREGTSVVNRCKKVL